ncbi:hypothetical protein AB4305_27840 [Nocardia sp. 2YAB30]
MLRKGASLCREHFAATRSSIEVGDAVAEVIDAEVIDNAFASTFTA